MEEIFNTQTFAIIFGSGMVTEGDDPILLI
jgi:hypothetical protein